MKTERGTKAAGKKAVHTAKAIPHFSRGHVASRRFFFFLTLRHLDGIKHVVKSTQKEK